MVAAGLHQPAITYWNSLQHTSQRLLGGEHPETLSARAYLTASYWSAGRTDEAIPTEEQVLADSERLLRGSTLTP